MSNDFAANFLTRQIAGEQETFARDVRNVADILNSIADRPDPQLAVGELVNLSTRVADLIRLGAKINATRETLTAMSDMSSDTPR
ncbi:hypothetical protein G3I51_24085 [Streptomyces sp. SID9944]|nr:hypothetical protein [Streptomyces sp. SID9944]